MLCFISVMTFDIHTSAHVRSIQLLQLPLKILNNLAHQYVPRSKGMHILDIYLNAYCMNVTSRILLIFNSNILFKVINWSQLIIVCWLILNVYTTCDLTLHTEPYCRLLYVAIVLGGNYCSVIQFRIYVLLLRGPANESVPSDVFVPTTVVSYLLSS